MKQAVMYGGGNIGRGFIGFLFSQSGYEVTFIDVVDTVIRELQEKRSYPLRFVTNAGNEDLLVENVTAVNGNDAQAAAEVIANCDIMATAVGARVLKFIIPNIVAGIRRRWDLGKGPLNIIICENLMDANKIVESMIKAQLTDDEIKRFDETVGLVEASIGRMVPVQTEEMKDGEPLRVCVERYGFLPVDKAAFKGDIPEIKNMVPFDPFDFYIKRKLFIHNMGHATCAYLGGFNGRKYIWQAIDDPDILSLVQNAMLDSAVALSGKYGVPLSQILSHITDLLGRFRNKALQDTCQRVGGDPVRKLGREDRLIGSSLLAMEQGIEPYYIALGAAGALYRQLTEAAKDQTQENAAEALCEISGLAKDHALVRMILDLYTLFQNGETPANMRRAVENLKAASMKDVI